MEKYIPVSDRMRLYSGIEIDVFNFKESDIDIKDIAHALSLMCRFAGHTKSFYSVAQHCIWIANNLKDEHKLEGLLHDASEAYLVDIPTPVKMHLESYSGVETSIMEIVFKKFGLTYPLTPEVKSVDKAALQYEWNNAVLADLAPVMTSKEAEEKFLEMFYKSYYEKTNGIVSKSQPAKFIEAQPGA